ncbi:MULTISPECIES: class I adenylate-forming enzyme family protein [Frankia]|uniref:Cyclohexanecarboxylate-CoA ligase n=2 Tax=Frankia TaxID=1854 RepID=Q0RKC1_FRAAA|nr:MULTISPECIES: AMP-binding protein [Frankia]CAJ62037.1 putative Cyclohexanecarboxylate-CoA ligase [Frankia alni ACN14a]
MSSADASLRQWWELVEARAAATPDLPMLVDNHDRRISFGEFRELALRVAAGLAATGVGAGTQVSWQLPTTIESAVLMSALSRLGAVQNPIIPLLREAEVDFIVEQLGTTLLIVPAVFRGYDYRPMAETIAARRGLRTMVCDPWLPPDPATARLTGPPVDTDWFGDFPLPLGDPATLPPPPPPPTGDADADVRWVFYSSGTTGFPKGARHTDASVIAGSNSMVSQLGFDETDVASIAFPIAHIGGSSVLSLGLRTACKVVLVDIFDPRTAPLALARHGSTMLGSAAPHFHAYFNAQAAYNAQRADGDGPEPLFARLRFFMAGGAPSEPGMHDRAIAELGGDGLMNGWGLTEFPMAGYPSPGDPPERLRTAAGRPGPGVRISVRDPDGTEVPRGEEGELCIAGPQLFAGYVDASLDAEAFTPDGYFHTGDLGIHHPEGWLYITGRLKDVIVRNAENISALEVENVLLTHPGIAEVAVVGLPDLRTGERCAAFVVQAEGAGPLTLPDLAAFCREKGLAVYKTPERLELLDAIPRNAMGKALKKQLRESVTATA